MSFLASLHESVEFTTASALSDGARDDVFRYCSFDGLDVEGQGFEGIAVACTCKSSAWLVEKTPAADTWFAAKFTQVEAAQAAALSAWQGKTPQGRAVLTLETDDAVLR